MEYTEGAVRDLLTGIVEEALAGDRPEIALNFAQRRFVKTDPAIVTCAWNLAGGGRSREFNVCFSGAAIENFADADQGRLEKLRAAAIGAIRESRGGFDPADTSARYPYQCLIDRLGV